MITLALLLVLDNWTIEPDYYICIYNETEEVYDCGEAIATDYDYCIKMYNILLCETGWIEA